MYKIAQPLFLFCESPLHAGSGSDLGVVDLPIQRERHTSFPKIESSSLKGALRERFVGVLGPEDTNLRSAFGPDSGGNDSETYASSLGFTDARLLLFPVKSMRGVFAWVTCPRVLGRFMDDMKTCGVDLPFSRPAAPAMNPNTSLRIKRGSNSIVLEAYKFEPKTDDENMQELGNWLMTQVFRETDDYWKQKAAQDVVVLSDDDFTDFVNLSTEVITRTQIDNETGTVKDGALFTEEYLPAESLMYSLVLAAPVFEGTTKVEIAEVNGSREPQAVMDFFTKTLSGDMINSRFQLGANATLGKGLIRTQTL
ncbi:MAG: type III-B CRISPR module RAMP protein Cmr4 [Bacteroidia bacterium]